jgi:hypothetical protein
MFAFNLKKYILVVKEKIVLINFGMLSASNKDFRYHYRLLNPYISKLSRGFLQNAKGFLFRFVIPFNLKTGRKSLNASYLVKSVIFSRLKIACSVLAMTTSALENPSMDIPTVKWVGSPKLNIGLWFLEATSLISREKNRYA